MTCELFFNLENHTEVQATEYAMIPQTRDQSIKFKNKILII